MKRVSGEAMASWSSCSKVKNGCVEWVEKYFKDCVCNLSSEISFALGLLSLFCWAIAEIPQIITNSQTKSGHGVSLALLLTWVIGDVFNLVGCLLEPVTLPTQFYTALLYTLTTVVLLMQTIYYDYFLRWWKNRGLEHNSETEEEKRKPLNPKSQADSSKPVVAAIPSATSCSRMDIYYTSARSLASSPTPPYGSSSYLVAPRSGPSATLAHDSSSDDETTLPAHRARFKPKRNFSRSVGYGTVIAASASLPFQAQSLVVKHLVLSGTTLFQETGLQEIESNSFGLLLGWIMAAIYMGGRLPQIYLNIKRGSVEGLSPLMFLFALAANASYVGSILVRSLEWERIKANAPWLLDAIVCVLLDLFIIIQFGYYKMMHRRSTCSEEAPTLA